MRTFNTDSSLFSALLLLSAGLPDTNAFFPASNSPVALGNTCKVKADISLALAAEGFGASSSSKKGKNKKGFDKKQNATTKPVARSDDATDSATPAVNPIMAAYEATSRGTDLMVTGALNAAIEAFSEALELHPTPDRQFRLALAYEENGEPLKASELYEAARDGEGADAVLQHDANVKLAHVWGHDLGDIKKGLEYLEDAMEKEGYEPTPVNDAIAWDQKAYFVADEGRLEEAVALWDKAIEGMRAEIGKSDVSAETKEQLAERMREGCFFRAVAKALLASSSDSKVGVEFASLPSECEHLVDSWNYASSHYPKCHLEDLRQGRFFAGTHTMLAEALRESRPDGLICEFGVFHGKSIRLIASLAGPDNPVDGFDTFQGIPEAWGDEPAGTYTAAAEIPQRVPANVRFHVGLFSDTLPRYVKTLPPAEEMPVRLINVDCDLYQGTVEILQFLSDRIGPGTVLIFDEYLMTPTWREDEYKAFKEAVKKYGWEYEYLSFCLNSKQTIVRITASKSFAGPAAVES